MDNAPTINPADMAAVKELRALDQLIINQKVANTPVKKIKLHPANPRRGDLGSIAESIAHNGFYGHIVCQESTGYILAGNHRYQALLQLGADKVPVCWVDVDDEEALRILLADNRTSDLAHTDPAELYAILQRLAESDKRLLGTGYKHDDTQSLLAQFQESHREVVAKLTHPKITVVIENNIEAPKATEAIARLVAENPAWQAKIV